MQGQRSGIGSFPGALSYEHGSTSSDAGIDQQIRWNTMQSSAQNIQPNYISLGQNLSGWNAGESSSSWTENVNNHHEQKAEYGWSSQMIACGAVGPVLEQQQYEPDNVPALHNASVNRSSNLIPNTPLFVQNLSNAISQDLNMSAGFVGEGSDDLQMMDWSDEPEVSQFPFASTSDSFRAPSERNAFFVEEDDARPSHSLDGRRSSCKRKVIDRNTGQSSISGSSSCFQQAESTGRYNAGSGLSISSPSGNIVAASESPLALNLARSAERSQRNYRGRISPSRQQDSVPINVFPMGNTVGHSNVASQQQSSRLVPLNNSLQMRPLSAADNTSSQMQSSVVHVPAFRPFPRLSRSNGGFLPSGSHASGSGDAVSNEESNSSSVPRNVSEHPMFIPANDMTNSPENATNWSLSAGNTSIAGNVASTSRVGSGSRFHQFSGPNRVPHRNPPQYPRRLSDLVRRSLLSSADAASGLQSNSHPSLQEMELSSGESNQGHSLSRSRGAISLDRQLEGALGMPHSLRTLAAASEGRSRLVSEIRGVLDLMHRGEGLRFEDVMILDQSVFFGMGHSHDRHRDMRLDVDNMSYEELLALGERIGNVSTGLSEEKILKGLKQRKYYSITPVSQLEREPCCVCQEEYNEGEYIGTLGCGHEFHATCIKQWLMHKNLCPICKTTAMNT
ncbi:probable E3 ubiquitin-protein ligase RHG1A isoform X2 [Rhododendron vialii]|uniref:probable E3 ubiquitin-protein ligase RHG1A isoform X2 n=1 Tax=Rhododendron vialii TaxID=182163 RepID=UPI0026601E45|nr:probable E3 ubiquitin-protein ligase RHG1A isoform X2 [Rhododendron vialii]XP_058222660.1 probable E3 ubiquitin-protein ligase RHG1A isoform X2 [Rhododendron vialii]XP_058222661.1 probable E3 ubiquitin-protein ligase RHG1A isoform X2 [Rhododendron vialii]